MLIQLGDCLEEGGSQFLKQISKNLNLKINDDYKYIRKNEDVFKGEKIKEKDIVLSYLTSFNKPTFATTGRVKDNVENVVVESKCDNGYDDGIYYWDETDIYHFKKYNMPLKQEFIDYVLNKWID